MNISVTGVLDATEDCCVDCLANIKEPLRFSFVYVQILISIILSILMLQFMVSIYQRRKDILKYHDTISSFCACKHDWNNRFLLMFTFITSGNLLCLHFEEFNSRNWSNISTQTQQQKLFIMFVCELACIVSLPLCGIFYTRGNDPDPSQRNTDYVCPYGRCKIQTSEKIHSFGTFMFMLGLCVTAIMWSVFYLDYFTAHTPDESRSYYPLSIGYMAWSSLQFLMGIIFGVIQLILGRFYLVKEAFAPPERFKSLTNVDEHQEMINKQYPKYSTVDMQEDDDDDDDRGRQSHEDEESKEELKNQPMINDPNLDGRVSYEQQKYRHIATRLRYFSFAVEAVTAASVILNVTMSNLIRRWLMA